MADMVKTVLMLASTATTLACLYSSSTRHYLLRRRLKVSFRLRVLGNTYIKHPATEQEVQTSVAGFFAHTGFPQYIY